MSELEIIATSAGILVGAVGFLSLLAYTTIQKINYWGEVAERIKLHNERRSSNSSPTRSGPESHYP